MANTKPSGQGDIKSLGPMVPLTLNARVNWLRALAHARIMGSGSPSHCSGQNAPSQAICQLGCTCWKARGPTPSDGLQHRSDGLQPGSDGLQPKSKPTINGRYIVEFYSGFLFFYRRACCVVRFACPVFSCVLSCAFAQGGSQRLTVDHVLTKIEHDKWTLLAAPGITTRKRNY